MNFFLNYHQLGLTQVADLVTLLGLSGADRDKFISTYTSNSLQEVAPLDLSSEQLNKLLGYYLYLFTKGQEVTAHSSFSSSYSSSISAFPSTSPSTSTFPSPLLEPNATSLEYTSGELCNLGTNQEPGLNIENIATDVNSLFNSKSIAHQFTVTTPSKDYPLIIGSGLLQDAGIFASYCQNRQVLIVTNTTVAQLYFEQLQSTLSPLCKQLEVVTVIDSEEAKTQPYLDLIYTTLLENNYSRNSLIIALGGGVVGDLAGYAAATYQRGISCIQIPTTLLSQVDSSVGGKTAINHALGKNMIGAFLQPDLVVIDVDTLQSLPSREFSAGLAEVIKYGLLAGVGVMHEIAKHLQLLVERDNYSLAHIIHLCCQIKAQVVAQDEKETACRCLLNLGHTYGHAIEAHFKYNKEWLHGEAVAVGMLLAFNTTLALVNKEQYGEGSNLLNVQSNSIVNKLLNGDLLDNELIEQNIVNDRNLINNNLINPILANHNLINNNLAGYNPTVNKTTAINLMEGDFVDGNITDNNRSLLEASLQQKLILEIVELLLIKAGLPTKLPVEMKVSDFLQYMQRDKKNLANQIVLILPTGLGTSTRYTQATTELISQVITSMS